VRLYLPRIEYQETSILSEPSVSDHAHLQGQGETLLVVEDDAGVRLFAVTALERMGYDIRQAGTAATALQILDATPEIALLFTDIVLPGDMDGVQLAAEAQRRRPGLRVLFTSGYTEHALVGNGRIMEGVEVLTKPYHKSELARKLCLLLRSSESTAS
jgi:DNA-binding NtrC family response regulator